MSKQIILIILLIFTSLLVGCSKDKASQVEDFINNIPGDVDEPLLDDDIVDNDPGGDESTNQENCISNNKLSLWLDLDKNGIVDSNDSYQGPIEVFTGAKTAIENYQYHSWSAHPENGPMPMPFESHIYFYEGSDGLTLNFQHNIDDGGSADNKVSWKILVKGNDNQDRVLLSDDNSELKLKQENINEGWNKYTGKWRYWKNTDGGVIGPLNGNNFEIHISVQKTGDIINGSLYSADGEVLSLIADDKIQSLIISFKEIESCKM